jgi:hypothetical protein
MNVHLRFEDFTAAFKQIHILWDVVPYRLVCTYRFGREFCLHLQGIAVQGSLPRRKIWVIFCGF